MKRIRAIKSYLSAEKLAIDASFERTEYVFPAETSEGYCIFFNRETERCMIHLVKPETCTAGPVTFDINVEKGTVEWYLKTENICRLSGVLYRDAGRLRRHLESAKREINALIKNLSKKELLAILCIEEPETFKIGEDPLDAEVLVKLRYTGT